MTAAIWVAVALSTLFVGLQLAVVRPASFPAGAGLILRAGPLAGALADPMSVRMPRPPDVRGASPGGGLEVMEVVPGGPADHAGIRAGDRLLRIVDGQGLMLDLETPRDARQTVAGWRTAWWLDVRRTFTATVAREGTRRDVEVTPRWFPDVPASARPEWLRRHAGPLVQMPVLLLAAALLLALGVRGSTAPLMTMALLGNIPVGGALVGAEAWAPSLLREPLVVFSWLLIPLGFPTIAWAVLNFPSPSPVVRRWPWLIWALVGLITPLIVSNGVAALFLLGATWATAPLTWFAERPLLWSATFVAGVFANTSCVVDGIRRYRRNPDLGERRRIQMVVYTGVPAAFAWAISEGLPLVGMLASTPIQLPWGATALLQLLMLLPAYAVVVKHVFSPRTVLRRSLQYALARRTLTALAVLPAVPLALSLITQRDMSLSAIVTGQPLFYVVGIALLVAARHYRERASRWLDRRFFRAEYDGREILMSLAGRMPFETDPAELVSLVIHHVDSALQPESVAVLAEIDEGHFGTLGARPAAPPALATSSGLATLMRWSRVPFEVFLDDDRAAAARLPAEDRAWIAEARVSLIVPLLTGNPAEPTLMGFIALGRKRSEEPYAPDDRDLLAAIAAQMSTSLDLSRIRRRATARAGERTGAGTPTALVAETALGLCPRCHRCVELSRAACPDDGAALAPLVGLPAVVDGKYRVDALVGKGGMGAVFRARDVRLDRDVAIKVVRPELLASADARRRFRREAQIVARLQHPAVVAIFDYGTFGDGAAYIVMEYVRGEDLRQRLRRPPPFGPAEIVSLVSRIASGVQAAHDADVLHRDLKPENILLPQSGADPKVLDFGVAKQAPATVEPDGTQTAGATVVGTPAYMAPEQLRGHAVDGRADVFSLGVMTFEMLTGTLPYGAGSFVDIGVAHAEGRLTGADRVPAALRGVVLSAIGRDPATRPRTPAELADALRMSARALP